MFRSRNLICLILTALPVTGLMAQDSLGWQRNQVIGINFQKRTLEPSYLPFDVPYRLYVVAPDSLGIDSIRVKAIRVISGRFRKPGTVEDQPLEETHWDTCRCGTKKKRVIPDDSANSIIIFKHDTYARGDTLYANINVPLRPNMSYSFRCTVFRRVTDKESQDLDSIFTPIIVKAVDSLYAAHTYKDILQALQNPDTTAYFVKKDLVDAMVTSVMQYYARKSIDPKHDSVQTIIKRELPRYLAARYGELFVKRLFLYQKIQDNIDTVKRRYLHNNAASFKNRRLFAILDSFAWDTTLSKKYHIDKVTGQFIRGILMDDDSLKLCVSGKRSEADSDFQENNLFLQARIDSFKMAITSFYDSCGRVINLINAITRDPQVRALYPGRDSTLLRDFAVFYDFYLAVQEIKHSMDAYYGLSVTFDSVMARAARFNFRNEFPIHFHDQSLGLTSADFMTRGSWYMIADVGFAYVNTYPTGQVRPYAGVNFNVFPVNRQANYSLFKHPNYTLGGNIIRSLSITVGVTVFSTFQSKDRYTELLGTTGSVLTGIALRLSDGIRLSSGAMWVYQKSGNPLSDSRSLVPLWYGALSVDLTLKKWLGGLAKFFN